MGEPENLYYVTWSNLKHLHMFVCVIEYICTYKYTCNW